MNEDGVSLVRLYVLRAAYVLLVVGLGLTIGPLLLNAPPDLEHMRGVVWALLGAVALLAALGVRHPLRMLPILMFELVWKIIWLTVLWWPRWSAGTLTPAWVSSGWECLFGVVLCLLVIPWGYVYREYVRGPAPRWSRA